jgi:uncharacterized protein YbbC (DUF1343 family)
MHRKLWSIIVVALLFATISLALSNRANQAQVPAALGTLLERYQMQIESNGSSVYVIDSHTGQVWQKFSNSKEWRDLGSPVKP